GGSNIQFATHPETGRMIVVEMNPRVSRSSALASKATGFPIAKIAAKLAVGYTLDEIRNDITRETPACFEPTIDYCVTKIPRWTFEKFPDADETLTTQMKSVGEAMSIGRTFKESLQKGIRSMEVKRYGLGLDGSDKWLNSKKVVGRRSEVIGKEEAPGGLASATPVLSSATPVLDAEWPVEEPKLTRKLANPCQGRPYYIRYAFKLGWSVDRIHDLCKIDRWFLTQLKQLVDFEKELEAIDGLSDVPVGLLRQAKQWGYSDIQLATIWRTTPAEVRRHREEMGIACVYKLVDTCAAEFEAYTPYYYSSYETPIQHVELRETGVEENPQSAIRNPQWVDDEVRITDKKKIVILGGGPNRIGQGIEFDYCCVHAAFAARELGFEAVMVNSNPETVSTDYDTSDMLFFEPLTLEDVLNICEKLDGHPLRPPDKDDPQSAIRNPQSQAGGLLHGVIVQFGGQTPLNLARGLEENGVPIIGTSPESIDLAEDRKRFAEILEELNLQCPPGGTAFSIDDARKVAERIGYPVLVRPSYVLGGRAMEIVSDAEQLETYMPRAVDASTVGRDHPILVDKVLSAATEVDVDCIADFGARPDGSAEEDPRAIVCGVMEHIEQAGIHSGDSACALPPYSLSQKVIAEIERQARLLAER
ncbi:MAG: carbamoyl phosphate synthase large subunit, partial [Phycisphaerae bacterium]